MYRLSFNVSDMLIKASLFIGYLICLSLSSINLSQALILIYNVSDMLIKASFFIGYLIYLSISSINLSQVPILI